MINFMHKTLLLFSFLPLLLSAQTEYSEGRALKFNGGFIGGVTTSQIHGDGIGGFNKMGVNAGATLEIGRKGKKNIQLGIIYNQKGSKKPTYPKAGDFVTWRYRFTYIDVPITISYSFGTIELLVGLQPSVLLAAEEDFNGYWIPTGLSIKSYDLGAVLGLRTMYSEHLYLFIRTSQSIVAIAPKLEGTVGWNIGMMNMTVELGLNYMIGKL